MGDSRCPVHPQIVEVQENQLGPQTSAQKPQEIGRAPRCTQGHGLVSRC